MPRNAMLIQLGARIKKLRLRKEISITEMAAYAGISRQHLSNVEHGKSELCVLALQKIADELGTTMARLLSGIPVAKPDRRSPAS